MRSSIIRWGLSWLAFLPICASLCAGVEARQNGGAGGGQEGLSLAYGESKRIYAANPTDAMSKAHGMLSGACLNGKEEILYLVEVKNGVYDLKRGDRGDGSGVEVEFTPQKEDVDKIVAILHNHPEISGSDGRWPSEDDAILGLKYKSDVFIRECGSQTLYCLKLRTKPRTLHYGRVYKVEYQDTKEGVRGYLSRREETYTQPKTRRCDGHAPYDRTQIARYAKDHLSSACLVDNREKKGLSLGLVQERSSGGYCKCPSPLGCVEAVVNERTDFAAHMGRKARAYGAIQFICGKCGKINESFYKKASKLKSEQQKQGLPTDWFDRQLQVLRNASTLQSAETR